MKMRYKDRTTPTQSERIFRKFLRRIYLSCVTDGVTRIELKRPLIVSIEKEGDTYIVSNFNINVHGAGESVRAAFLDFQRSFVHFCEYYGNMNDDLLTDFGMRIKSMFNELCLMNIVKKRKALIRKEWGTRKAHYVWLVRGNEKILAYYYENPDTKQWGYGFNIADGGGFMPESDLTDDTKVLTAVVGIAV